jgi:hypothetical protein
MTIKFELRPVQEERYLAWKKKHLAERHPNGVRDSMGTWCKFTFIPTGIGPSIEVSCLYCEDGVDLSLDDDGSFCVDYPSDSPSR